MEYKIRNLRAIPTEKIFEEAIKNLQSKGLRLKISKEEKRVEKTSSYRYISRNLSSLWVKYETEEHRYLSEKPGEEVYDQKELSLYKTYTILKMPIKITKKEILKVYDYSSRENPESKCKNIVRETIVFSRDKKTTQLVKTITNRKNLEKIIS
jgi:hypothetical protein